MVRQSLSVYRPRQRKPAEHVGVVSSDYLSAVEIVENVALRWVPRPVITRMTATAIPEAISPYSIAVAALATCVPCSVCWATPRSRARQVSRD